MICTHSPCAPRHVLEFTHINGNSGLAVRIITSPRNKDSTPKRKVHPGSQGRSGENDIYLSLGNSLFNERAFLFRQVGIMQGKTSRDIVCQEAFSLCLWLMPKKRRTNFRALFWVSCS